MYYNRVEFIIGLYIYTYQYRIYTYIYIYLSNYDKRAYNYYMFGCIFVIQKYEIVAVTLLEIGMTSF
jgi:hypothetical protein